VSRPALLMSPEEVAELLHHCRRAQFATINADGTPHVVPMSYVVLDGRVTLWTDPRSRKVANLRRDPRVTCLVEDGNHFAEFRAVQLCGRGAVDGDPQTSLRTGLALFARSHGGLDDALRATVAALVPTRVAVTVHPERIVSWDHRKLPGVRPDEIGS
jgi:PPOX class probable F420-dependent enzyme